MIARIALLCVLVVLVIASVRTEPLLEVSAAQQIVPGPTGTVTTTPRTAVPPSAPATATAPPPTAVPPTATTPPTATAPPTATVHPTATSLPTATRSPTLTASPTPFITPSPSPTFARPSATPTFTFQPFIIPTLIRTPTRTPFPTSTPTPTLSLVGLTTTPGVFVVPTLIRTPGTMTALGALAATGDPPVVLQVAETSITRSSATITWTTNVPTSSEVDYGTGTQLTRSPVDAALVTSHTMVLTGLSAGTPYAYRVRGLTGSGAIGVSDPGTFSTLPDGSGGDITGMTVRRVTASTATLAWTTSTGQYAQVEYGPSANYGASTLLKVFGAATPAQEMLLTNLAPGTSYHFRVKTWDASGNLGASSDFGFRTALAGPNTLAGDATILAEPSGLPGGQAAAYQYVATQSGQASVVRLYLDTATSAAAVRVAVYADVTGSPGAIVAQGSAPGLTPGWVSVAIPPISILQGQTYWIAVLSPVGGGAVNVRGAVGSGSSRLSRQTALAAFPALWTAGGPAAKSRLSVYLQQVPPAVSVTAPSDGASVAGVVPLSAVVDDDVAITRLQFYVDGVPVGPSLVAPPYTVSWDTSGIGTTQPHTITARAYDVADRAQLSGGPSVQVDNGPNISTVAMNPGLTSTSARITWTTDALSDSQVEIGTTTAYGLATPTDTRATWNHDMQLTGLAPGTVYHYRVRSRDASGALAVSPDATLSTTAEP